MITIDFTTKPEITPEYFVSSWGDKFLYDENGKTHSYNALPAIIWSDGAKEWHHHGKYHSYNDLPDIVYPNGTKLWHKYGKLHRDNNLPAVIWADGSKEYWVNGMRIK